MRSQLVNIELGGIEQNVSHIAYRIEPLSLRADRGHDRLATPQGMRPARFRKAPHQHILMGFQKDHTGRQHRANLLQDRREAIQPHAFAHIDHQCRALDFSRLGHQVGEARDQLQRQVIHRVEAKVLEGLQR